MEDEIRRVESIVEAARVIIQSRILGESFESTIVDELAEGLAREGHDWAAGMVEGFLEAVRPEDPEDY